MPDMDHVPVYTALNVPTATSYPSANSLQWSGDGQVCLGTKSAVYIMTPDPGINIEPAAVIRSPLEEEGKKNGGTNGDLGWFRTMIQFDKNLACRWPEYIQDAATQSLGSMDVSVWSISLSPSNVTSDAGCALAILTTNMDFSLWTAEKNSIRGEWIQVCDVTAVLIAHFQDDETRSKLGQVLASQITCIDWSSNADFGIRPVPRYVSSLLVGGNRTGSLVFLRYDGKASVSIVMTVDIAESWITHVHCSSWTSTTAHTCESWVSYAAADGSVGFVKVTQKLQSTPPTSPFGIGYKIDFNFDEDITEVCSSDKRAVTALKWVGPNQTLVYCKPGTVDLWYPPPDERSRHLILKKQKLSVGSSIFHPVSGLQYVPGRDALLLALFDGTVHLICNVSSKPTWDSPDDIATETISTTVRSVFTRSEQEPVQFEHVNSICGLICYDLTGTILWVHESSRPADFSYKHDAKHNSMLIVAGLWDDFTDDRLVEEIQGVLGDSTTVSGNAPPNLLRSAFFQLHRKNVLARLHAQLLDILQAPVVDESLEIRLKPFGGQLSDEVLSDLRGSLGRHLFGWDKFMCLRMKLAFADFAWKLSTDAQRQADFGNAAQQLLNTISHRNLRAVIRHLWVVVSVLTKEDVPFVLRMVVQSLLPGAPVDLSQEGQIIAAELHKLFPEQESLSELCPACRAEIPLEDITTGVCPNGHRWARCSVTTFILSTGQVRTCIGCTRKAFLPSAWDRGWFMRCLLEAAHRCLFCGNSFVSFL